MARSMWFDNISMIFNCSKLAVENIKKINKPQQQWQQMHAMTIKWKSAFDSFH